MSDQGPAFGRLELELQSRRQRAVIDARGELDAATAHQLVVAVCEALEDHHSVELDLSGITFIDAAGFGALETCASSAAEHRWDFFVSGNPRALTRITHALPRADRIMRRFRNPPSDARFS